MPSIGPLLSERREAMGVTLAEAEVATRIRQKYLAAIERDEWDLLPGEVVGRGFLRNYATYLGLDPTEMIDRRRAIADDSLAAVLANTSAATDLPPERKVDYRPKDVALKDEGDEMESPRQINLTPFFVVFATVAVVALLVWGFHTV
jgi:transcriptional regulator with XRE-family HTH domain